MPNSLSSRVASKYINILRITVTAALFALALTFGFLSYYSSSAFEHHSAVERFHNIAHYGLDTLRNDFGEKENVLLGMAKHMAYFNANASAWPNVVLPGFYDSVISQRDSANLDDIFFLPIVKPEQLPSYEVFSRDYFANEPEIGPEAGIPSLGVYAFGATGPYQDTTGETFAYNSPHRILTPMLQELFSEYISKRNLGLNMHSTIEFGLPIDAIIACSQVSNYSTAARECVDITGMVNFPLGSTGSDVEDFHTAFLQPIYLHRNTSMLVGFMGGGFNWEKVLTKVLSDSIPGVEVVLRNGNRSVTFLRDSSVNLVGFGDLHDSSHNHLEHSVQFFATPDGGEDHSTYTVSFYPTDKFFNYYKTSQPFYAGVGSFVALTVCAAVFFLYDYYVRGATAAHEAVLETKRRFVRFISHEIRTPLNAVHLGLEALIAELRRTLDLLPASPLHSHEDARAALLVLETTLSSWLELSVEMTSNCDSAEDVLNDLLNYDKIEMGTLYLDFSSLVIWDVVKTNATVFHNHVKQKKIVWSLENHLISAHEDLEGQDSNNFIVVGDSARLAQVMRNLISNALKFTPVEGSIHIKVERVHGGLPHPSLTVPADAQQLLQQPRAGSVRISVTDSGAGLSEAQLALICSEGVQFNANELQAGKGSGLGLFITKGIVEQHGGKLTVTSAGIGAGTTFAVELPLFVLRESVPKEPSTLEMAVITHKDDSHQPVIYTSLSQDVVDEDPFGLANRLEFDTVPRPPTPRSTARSTPPVSPIRTQHVLSDHAIKPAEPKRILVVDDASSNRKMLVRILTAKGYVCEQAEDGQQAIEVYRASVASGLGFYAITMDFEMPVMNGPTATGHLRALGCTVPIVGVTGNMLPEDLKYFKAQGATEVIGKPVNVNKFQELMLEHEMKANCV